jgi:hypothetical protein
LIAAAFAVGAVWPSPAFAQRRGRGPVVVVSRPAFGAFYDPFFYQYGYPWGWGSPYGYGYPYGYRYDPTADIRLIVTPKTADVYVDGNKVGIVDNFDGVFQSLGVIPGPHELVVYQEGYRAIHQEIDVRPGTSYKLQYTMVPLQNGESMEPRPVPAPPPAPQTNGEPSNRIEPNAPYGPPPRGGMRGGPPPPNARNDASFGSVAIRVQPSDATITIDGSPWQSSEGADRLTVQLSDGRHHVEISKPGFKKYSADIDIRRGQTTTLNVSLQQSDSGV